MDELAISMEEPMEKLENLKNYLPSVDQNVAHYAQFLATYLNSRLTPLGFVIGCMQALFDLLTGVNMKTGRLIRGPLMNEPQRIYDFLQSQIPTIAAAVFPEDFAANVKVSFDDLSSKLHKTRTQ